MLCVSEEILVLIPLLLSTFLVAYILDVSLIFKKHVFFQ